MNARKKKYINIVKNFKEKPIQYTYAGEKAILQEALPDQNITTNEEFERCFPFFSPENYGKNLRNIRKQQNITLKDVADQIGITEQNVDAIERGKRKIIDRTLLMLFSNIYGINPEFLLSDRYPDSDSGMNMIYPIVYGESYVYQLLEFLANVDMDFLSLLKEFSEAIDKQPMKGDAFLKIPLIQRLTERFENEDSYQIISSDVHSYSPEYSHFYAQNHELFEKIEMSKPGVFKAFLAAARASEEERKAVAEIIRYGEFCIWMVKKTKKNN